MSYKEWKDSGKLYKCYRNDAGQLHRYDGPSIICCHPDGWILFEQFWINGECMGSNKDGFWNLWDILSEERRRAPDLLECLARYS